jgi:hypothetical protein
MSEQVLILIDKMSEKLQIPFEKSLEIATKQLKYMAIVDILWIVGLVILNFLLIKLFIKIYKQREKEEGWWYEILQNFDDISIITAIWICFLIVSCFIVIGCVGDLMQIIINPDYSIIKLIIRIIK